MLYPPVALERAMTIREVVLRAMSGEITWIQAAEIIGCTPRSMRRWRGRLLVRRHLDGRHSIWWGPRCLGRYTATGRPLVTRAA